MATAKTTLTRLASILLTACKDLRGSMDASEYKEYIFGMLLSRDAGVGKSAITTEPLAVSQYFMC